MRILIMRQAAWPTAYRVASLRHTGNKRNTHTGQGIGFDSLFRTRELGQYVPMVGLYAFRSPMPELPVLRFSCLWRTISEYYMYEIYLKSFWHSTCSQTTTVQFLRVNFTLSYKYYTHAARVRSVDNRLDNGMRIAKIIACNVSIENR